MKISRWSIDDLIEYLQQMKSAPKDRLSDSGAATVRGEIFIENGEEVSE